MRLSDGSTGYFVQRSDDCWRAAAATVLRIPIWHVPDPHFDAHLAAGQDPEKLDRSARAEFATWLASRGLRMTIHAEKLPLKEERWIGVVPLDGWFNSHCLVMRRDRLLFDPANFTAASRTPLWLHTVLWSARDIRVGYSFRAAAARSKREGVN